MSLLKPPTQLQGITDLTLFADIKLGLIEGIFDNFSYANRLEKVLMLLDAARRTSRESDLQPNPFADAVGRLRGVHFFRFAILPPGDRLFLNVTFDGGWEPYMRLIWRPLGTLLDLIFCHCEDYPQAAVSNYDDYIAWVREREVPSQFFYADSPGTAADRTYLNRLESQQRSSGGRPGADLRAAQLALGPMAPVQPTAGVVLGTIAALKGLYGMTRLFGVPPAVQAPTSSTDDWAVLLRFAQDYLPDLREWIAQGLFDPGQPFDTLRASFERERAWLMSPHWIRPARRDPVRPIDPAELQAGILHSPAAPADRHARGALVLVRVTDPAAARAWLSTAPIADANTKELADVGVVCTVAITHTGLSALEVHEDHLAALPAEFRQGMEARAGILGDLRINHPQQWRRPHAKDAIAPIDLGLVHLLIQLRTCETAVEAAAVVQGDRSALLPRLDNWIDFELRYLADGHTSSGLEVLAIEPAWSKPRAPQELAARNHFGYVDGISQPRLDPSPGNLFWDDFVKSGELLLGRVNDRGDGPLVAPDGSPLSATPAWMEHGTFLVVRKIRQFVERFDAIVDQAAAALLAGGDASTLDDARERIRAKLMGRASNGAPLADPRGAGDNDFSYRLDADGAKCPFASHVRRANPRAASPGGVPPRIVRRGMAYGPPPEKENPKGRDADDRGVLFMAYNASIAEQFEVIQRWMTGGNSSGVSSSQADPFLGVPRAGAPTVFRFADGDRVVRVELGDQPISRLEWGLYAFVPTLPTLRTLDDLVAQPGKPRQSAPLPMPEDPDKEARRRVKDEFDDEKRRDAGWERVRDRSGVEKIGKTVMVGSYATVMQVLRDDGRTYSVSGYGSRMSNGTEGLGASPFGEDDAVAHHGHQRDFVAKLKTAVAASIPEHVAYGAAYGFTAQYLSGKLGEARRLGLPAARIDLAEFGSALIAELCRIWFGVEYGTGVAEIGPPDRLAEAKPVRCPGHFLTVARSIFSAYPNDPAKALAARDAPALKSASARWAAAASPSSAPVLDAALRAIDETDDGKRLGAPAREGIVANLMLGLPATLLGTWLKVMKAWSAERELWLRQHELALPPGVRATYEHAEAVLREPLVRTMAKDPVADGIWRTVAQEDSLGDNKLLVDDIVWLGLGSALVEKEDDLQATEDLLFGGALQPHTDRSTPHACPGRGMAIGALLGVLAAWLQAGQWAQTPSPTVLTLKP